MATNLENLNWQQRVPESGCPLGATFEAEAPNGTRYLLVPNVHNPELLFPVRLGCGKSPTGWYRNVNGQIRKIG